jgi:hypothetical protein
VPLWPRPAAEGTCLRYQRRRGLKGYDVGNTERQPESRNLVHHHSLQPRLTSAHCSTE